jgi:hypothetical protein
VAAQVVKKMATQERTHYTVIAASFKPIIGNHVSFLDDRAGLEG